MTFPFSFVCELLSQLDKQHRNGGQSKQNPSREAILARWFKDHKAQLNHPSTNMIALFSTLLPEKRVDRVYGIRLTRLAQIIGRACCLGTTRRATLHMYEKPDNGDLADCVMKVMEEAPNPMYNPKEPVTVEEVDALLDSLASNSHFSSAAVQSRRSATKPITHEDLGFFFLRLSPVESMWLTRLVLKAYGGASLDAKLVYRTYDSRLPKVLLIQDDFDTALHSFRMLRNAHPLGIGDVLKHVKPLLGTKVGRQTWLKGRTIKDCVDLSPGRISCEKKMDGEYCQVHIDMSKRYDNIQIFSKSGKDSTRDRQGLHEIIWEALKLGREGQAISRNCILEGELVVYNDRDHKIMPFDIIRKYASRSGVYIGTKMDSPRDPAEHLMIVFFDVLLLDDESLLGLRQTKRFDRLEKLITCRTGYAELVKRQVIDLDRNLGVSHLRKALAESIMNREEGLVLKPDEPYFHFGNAERKFFCCPIKVKKEYFKGLGDIGDFAVVGARYDAAHAKAKAHSIPGLKWTHFFLGCLENKQAAVSHQEKPRFVVVDLVELNLTQLKNFIQFVHPDWVDIEKNDAFELRIPPRMSHSRGPSVVFTTPPVFDVCSFGFNLEGNTGFHTPRFSRVSKIHYGRDFMDTVAFDELESMAKKARESAPPDDQQEMMGWIATLEAADPQGRAVDAASQSTVSSEMTPSPRSCSARQSQSQQSLGVSPTKRPERIYTVHAEIHRAPARSASLPDQTPPPSAGWVPGRTASASAPAPCTAPRQNPGAGRPELKRSHLRPSTTTVEAKRQRKSSFNQTVTTTSSPPAIKQSAIMASSSPDDQSLPIQHGTTGVQQNPDGSYPAVVYPATYLSANHPAPPTAPINSQPVIIANNQTALVADNHGLPSAPIADALNEHVVNSQPAIIADTQTVPAANDQGPPAVTQSIAANNQAAPAATQSVAANNQAAPTATAATQPVAANYMTLIGLPINNLGPAFDAFDTVTALINAAGPASAHPPLVSERCRYLGGRCSMPGRSVLLAPCCQGHKFLTQTLLPSHGINEWATDPREWAQDADEGVSIQSGSPPPEELSQSAAAQLQQQLLGQVQPLQTRFPRKICFVESAHTGKLRELITEIDDLELTQPNGDREWVEVFDWRALETMLEIEIAVNELQMPAHEASEATTRAVAKHFVGLA